MQCTLKSAALAANYPGGKAYFEALPNPPGWVAFSDFASTPDDLPFRLVLSPQAGRYSAPRASDCRLRAAGAETMLAP